MNIQKTISVEFELSPEELAETFWSMNSDDQCFFFKRIYEIIQTSNSFDLQMSKVANSQFITDGALSIMRSIGDQAG
jgi:hypothetical protein